MPRKTQKMAFVVLNFSEGFGMDKEKQEKNKLKTKNNTFWQLLVTFYLLFLTLVS